MLKAGKRTREWERVRAKLKVRFESAGITRCEFVGAVSHDCWRDNGLSFAHVDKRLHLKEGELTAVALACPNAHWLLDNRMSRHEMRKIVEGVISNRICQP